MGGAWWVTSCDVVLVVLTTGFKALLYWGFDTFKVWLQSLELINNHTPTLYTVRSSDINIFLYAFWGFHLKNLLHFDVIHVTLLVTFTHLIQLFPVVMIACYVNVVFHDTGVVCQTVLVSLNEFNLCWRMSMVTLVPLQQTARVTWLVHVHATCKQRTEKQTNKWCETMKGHDRRWISTEQRVTATAASCRPI